MRIGGTRVCVLALGLAALVVLFAGRAAAQAQPPAQGQGEAETQPQGQASAPAAPHHEDSPEVVEARRHIATGTAFFNANNYEGALAEFQRAYDLLRGKPVRYIVLFNMGQCHERLFQYDQALELYQRYLDEGGPAAQDRATVLATMHALEGLLGTVRVSANVPSARVLVDEREVGRYDGTHHDFRMPAGIHNVELRAPGYVSLRHQVEVAARSSASATFALEHVSNYHGLSRGWFWSSLIGAGVVAATGFAIGGYALEEHNRLQALADDTSNPMHTSVTAEDDRRITTLATVADILGSVAGALTATSLILALLTDWSGGHTGAGHAANTTASLGLTPALSPTFAGLSLSGAL